MLSKSNKKLSFVVFGSGSSGLSVVSVAIDSTWLRTLSMSPNSNLIFSGFVLKRTALSVDVVMLSVAVVARGLGRI